MAYPTNLIQEGETVALDLRPHWWYFSRNILTGIPLAIILILVLGSDDDGVSKYGGFSSVSSPSRGRSGSGSSTWGGG